MARRKTVRVGAGTDAADPIPAIEAAAGAGVAEAQVEAAEPALPATTAALSEPAAMVSDPVAAEPASQSPEAPTKSGPSAEPLDGASAIAAAAAIAVRDPGPTIPGGDDVAAAPASASPATVRSPAVPTERRSRGLLPLAAAVAIAAGLGAVIGSIGSAALGIAPTAPLEIAAEAAGVEPIAEEMAALASELAALTARIEASGKAVETRLGALAEQVEGTTKGRDDLVGRLDKLAARLDASEAVTAATAAKIGETHARLDSPPGVSDPLTTAAVAPLERPVPAAAPPAAEPPPVIDGWVLRDVYRGRALVEGRQGLFDVAPGSTIPGIGPVETIKRQNGRWMVVTPKGIIASSLDFGRGRF